MGERDRLTNRQRERSGEKKDRTRKTEPSKEESGGFDRRKALSDVKQLKKGLGIKAVDFVQELDRLDGLLMRMKKKDGDPSELQVEFQTALQEATDKVAGKSVEVVGNGASVEKQPDGEKKVGDVAERLASVVGLDKNSVDMAEIEKRRLGAREKWKEDVWDKKEGIFTLPDGSKIEMRGGGPLGYCVAKFGAGKGKDWFDGTVNFIYKYRQRDKDGNLEKGFGTDRARIRILFRGAQAEEFEVNVKIGEKEIGANTGKGLAELKQILLDARKYVGEEVEKKFGIVKPPERKGRPVDALKKDTHVPKARPLVSQQEPDDADDQIGNLKEPTSKQSVGAEKLPDKPEKKEVKESVKAFGTYALWFFKMRTVFNEAQKKEFWQKNDDFAKFSQFTGIKEEKHWRILFVEFAPSTAKIKDGGDDGEKSGYNGTQFLDNASAASTQYADPASQSDKSREIMELGDEHKDPKEDTKRFEHYEYLTERESLDKKGAWQDAVNGFLFALTIENKYKPPVNGVVEGNGLVDLKHPELPTVFIPDLHARRYMLLEILKQKNDAGQTYFDLLREGKINIIVGGDATHSEGRNQDRWKKADEAGDGSVIDNASMNGEMVESLNTIKMVMDLKSAFSENFHYIRGNHDDHDPNGELSFAKYANEQEMMINWMKLNFDDRWGKHLTGESNEDKSKLTEEERLKRSFLDLYAKFEKSLPLAVRGKEFVASHAVPARGLSDSEKVIQEKSPEARKDLLWGDSYDKNSQREESEIELMTDELLKDCPAGKGLWFGAHRNHDAEGGKKVLCDGRALEINNSHDGVFIYFNPEKFAVDVKKVVLARQEAEEKKKMSLIKTDEVFA